ncbi:MAG: polysaccharide deacetylase family protein [Chitinophagaceae bacterium]|nr:polysaccharide deacetylase family protein [Chitinophagaceae bacterium]
MLYKLFIVTGILFLNIYSIEKKENFGKTEITKWQYGKSGAISLTYDDGSINQFREALPIMNRLGFPATFFIVTGELKEAKYPAKFIGRPVEEIIGETKNIPTNQENFFERASAVGFLGYKGTLQYHFQAGQLYEQGKIKEAYKVIDSAYAKVIAGAFNPGKDVSNEAAETAHSSWEDFRKYAAQGHEFGSHTISHPRLAVLDEENMLYELEKSKEDILNHLGPEHTFSAEGPFGTENERVMEYALKLFPALRNRMPHPFLEELNRSNKMSPGSFDKEYVQWQRGPLTETPMSVMKSWVDTLLVHENIWLTLVFHGVSGIGWQAKPHEELATYFQYIKDNEDKLWVGTFGDVTKYMRERMNAEVKVTEKENQMIVSLTHSLDKTLYSLPLTLKTYILPNWKNITVKQNNNSQEVKILNDDKGKFILYQASPNKGSIVISGK